MTKLFCDLCGEPASGGDFSRTFEFKSPNLATPKTVNVTTTFRMEDQIRSKVAFGPDICPSCAAKMLRELADGLVKPIKTP